MRRFVGFFILALAACSSSSGKGTGSGSSVQMLPGFSPGAAPDPSKGLQIITPIVDDIEPGGSYEYCTDTDIILQQDTWVNATESWQTETGHHVVMYYTMNPVTPGTHLCQDAEMADFRYGLADGANSTSQGTLITFPGNLAAKLPAGAQIVVNHHYLNAGQTAVAQAQSAINIYYADPTVPHTPTNVMVVSDSMLSVPVGASTYTVDCTLDQDYNGWMEIPHAHSLAQHMTVTNTPAATGLAQQLFNMDWDPNDAFDPTIATTQDLSAPMAFKAGDKIHVECDYMNNTGQTATFGTEMCLFVAFTIDPNDIGGRICDRGQWGPL